MSGPGPYVTPGEESVHRLIYMSWTCQILL